MQCGECGGAAGTSPCLRARQSRGRYGAPDQHLETVSPAQRTSSIAKPAIWAWYRPMIRSIARAVSLGIEDMVPASDRKLSDRPWWEACRVLCFSGNPGVNVKPDPWSGKSRTFSSRMAISRAGGYSGPCGYGQSYGMLLPEETSR